MGLPNMYVVRYGRRASMGFAAVFCLLGLSRMLDSSGSAGQRTLVVVWLACWAVVAWRIHHASQLRFSERGVRFPSLWRRDRCVVWKDFGSFETAESRQSPGVSVMIALRTADGSVLKSGPMSVLRRRAPDLCAALNDVAQHWSEKC